MAATSEGKYLLWVFVVCVLHTLASGYAVWEGEPAMLKCNRQNGHPSQDIVWQKAVNGDWIHVVAALTGGTPNVPNGSRWKQEEIKIDSEGSLRIAAVSYPRDNATFRGRCGDETVYKELQVYYKIKALTLTGTQLPVPEDTVVSFTCETDSGNPPPNITWEIPDPSVQPGTTLAGFNSHVTLTATRDMNSEVIRCTATQDVFTVETKRTLEIMYKPRVTISPSPTRYEDGDLLELMCSCDGNPSPEVTWWNDGKPVRNHTRRSNAATNNNNSLGRSAGSKNHVTSFITVTASKTTYTCSANNSEGSGSDSYVLEDRGSQITTQALFLACCGVLLMAGTGACYKLCKWRLGRTGNGPQLEDQQVVETAVYVVQGSAHESVINLLTSVSRSPSLVHPRATERVLPRWYPMIPLQACDLSRPMARGCTIGPRMQVGRNHRAMY